MPGVCDSPGYLFIALDNAMVPGMVPAIENVFVLCSSLLLLVLQPSLAAKYFCSLLYQ